MPIILGLAVPAGVPAGYTLMTQYSSFVSVGKISLNLDGISFFI